jgi:hypothetical protein
VLEIKTPRGRIVQSGNSKVELVWNKNFAQRRTVAFSRAQSFIDSEVLRGCAKLIPLRTSMLIKSGTLGTVIGSGTIRYIAPYARRQYYENNGLGINGERGRLWFERWKAKYKTATLQKARTLTGASGKD